MFTKAFVDPIAWCHALTLLSVFKSIKYVGNGPAACSLTAAVAAGAYGALVLPAVPPFPVGPAPAEEQAMGGGQRNKRSEKKVKFRSQAAAAIAVRRQDSLPDMCCGGSSLKNTHRQEPNTQHNRCGKKLFIYTHDLILSPAAVQPLRARLCAARQARKMEPDMEPEPPAKPPPFGGKAPPRSNSVVPVAKAPPFGGKVPPIDLRLWPARAKELTPPPPKRQESKASMRSWSHIPTAHVEPMRPNDTQRICDRLGIDVIEVVGHMQPKSPPKQPALTVLGKPSSTPSHPFPSSVSSSSVPKAPNPFDSAPVNYRKATNEEMARSAKWAKIQRETRESAAELREVEEIVGGGPFVSNAPRIKSRYVVDVVPKPSTSHDASSLTAAGSSDPWSSPAAGNVTSSLTAGVQPNRDPESHVEAVVDIPSPIDEPSTLFGIFGNVPAPVASSPPAVSAQPSKRSQRALCVEHKDKDFEAMIRDFGRFDPVAFARTYDFTMSKGTDPVSKQINTRLREMRDLVFDVLPNHAARHLKWWKTQCVATHRTFKKDSTHPVYVISLWATSIKAGSEYQEFWAKILDLIKDFDPDELDDNLVLSQFLQQPFTKPGAICLAITDSTWLGYAPTWAAKQQLRWDEAGVCDHSKGWRTEQVGKWLQKAMISDAWPSKGWSCVHQMVPHSPLSMSEVWKAAAAGPSVPRDAWTKTTNNTSVKQYCTSYLQELLEPALKRAKGLREHKTVALVREFFDSPYGVVDVTKEEKKAGLVFRVVAPKPPPVTTPVTVTLADFVLCSTGLNGANPGTHGLYDQPATYVSAQGPQMPDEIHDGLFGLVGCASSLGKFSHVSAGQCATTYGYRNDGEWQHAAEKSCHDIKYDSRINKEYTIDTCAGIDRDSMYTRKDLGHWDSWHFVLHLETCEIVMRHELNKLKFMDCLYLDEKQMQGWIELLTLGRSSSASSLTAADGSTAQPESLSKLLVPPVIPFEPIFIPGLSARTTAEAPIIYQICDGDVLVDPDSHEPDAPGTVVPESSALPKLGRSSSASSLTAADGSTAQPESLTKAAPLAAPRKLIIWNASMARPKQPRSRPEHTYTVPQEEIDRDAMPPYVDRSAIACPHNISDRIITSPLPRLYESGGKLWVRRSTDKVDVNIEPRMVWVNFGCHQCLHRHQ